MLLKHIHINVLFLAALMPLLSCRQQEEFTVSIKGADSTSSSAGSNSIGILLLNNPTTDTVIVTDYKVSCECTLLNDIQNPLLLYPKSKREIAFTLKSDSSDKGKLKIITFTFKTKSPPYFYSTKFKNLLN